MLREAASRVEPLTLRLMEGPVIFRLGPTYYGGWLVNNTTPARRYVEENGKCCTTGKSRGMCNTYTSAKPE